MKDWAELISALTQVAWLGFVLIVIMRLREPLSNLIQRLSRVHLKLPNGTEVEITA